MKRSVAVLSGSLLVGSLLIAVMAGPAAATTFSNSTFISIPSVGNATPYPSTISVSTLTGMTITDVNVTLSGLNHTFTADVDVLLVAPNGDKTVLMADAGSSSTSSAVTLTFDQSAAASLPGGTITSGTYKPTSDGGLCPGFCGGPPAPAGPYPLDLNVFNGDAPNGTWSLFVYDDLGGDTGNISGGWSMEITTAPAVTSFAPTSGSVGTSVVITGINFSGTSSVRFGGVSAAFTENSTTQITATVPAGAVTGPIQVTGAFGTATSAGTFTVTVLAPTVTGFSPGVGKVGASVVITGTNFTNASSVKFNGVSAAFVVNTSSQISATVPATASTGLVSVTTPGGTGTSVAPFVVQHKRGASLHFSPASGNVTVNDGFSACAASVPVKLQHLVNGHWRTVASGITTATGAYNLGNPPEDGKYRTLAKKVTTASGDVCLKAKSHAVHT